jgi:predicted dehydrogenase
MSRPLAIGVIGVGSIGWHHARHLAACPGVELVGVYDLLPDRTRFVAERLDTRPFPSRASLLRHVQAVTVAVSTPAHAEVGLAAIEAGLPVLIEKPLAANLREAAALVNAADQRGLLLQVGQIERFNRALRAAGGYLGRPLFIEGQRLAPFQLRGTDVPVVLDLMIHDLDLILHLTGGAEAGEVRAAGAAVLSPHLDVAHARVEFAGGTVASVTASRIAQDRIRRLRIYQQDGCLNLDLAAGTGEFLHLRNRWQPGDADPAITAAERIVLEAPAADALRLELTSFLHAVRGEHEVVVTGREGLAAVHLAELVAAAVQRSPLEPAHTR